MNELREIPLDLIDVNSEQPRKVFDKAALQELAASIREIGLLQPITVRVVGERFEIIAGERRWRATQLAGLPTIQAHVREMDVDTRDVAAIVENLQRKDISELEQATAYQRMLDRGWSKEDLAKKLGLTQAWRIDEALQLLQMKPEYRDLLGHGQITVQQARELCRLQPANQDNLFRLIKSGAVRDYNHLRGLTLALLNQENQPAMFTPAESGVLADEDREAISALERKIEQLCSMVSMGFDARGAIDVCRKVRPDRAVLLADKLEAIAKAISPIAKEMRRHGAQAELVIS